jgi:hypothetical protein
LLKHFEPSAFHEEAIALSRTQHLDLPYILASQADKHVSFNEAIGSLDYLLHLAVETRTLTVPPPNPVESQRYIPAVNSTGDWTGLDGAVVAFTDGGWQQFVPQEGWQCWVIDEAKHVRHRGGNWELVPMIDSINPAAMIGINTTADATNRLAIKSDAVLMSYSDGGSGDMRLKLNKGQASATGSLLFQSNWSARAEIGLLGSSSLTLKVSSDGNGFKTALIADPVTATIQLPGGLIDTNTGRRALTLVPGPVKDIWRSDMDSPPTPRTYMIASIAGDAVTLTTNDVDQLFCIYMRDISKVRIWNISKSPAQSAWIKWNTAANVFQVHQASDIASWAPGETLRLGDPNPTHLNALNMIALDIGDYLLGQLGAIFPQRGLKVSISPQGIGGRVGIDCSGTGALGSALGTASNSDGARQSAFADVFTSVLSPISNSNLLFIRESITAPATALAATRLIRIVGVWV